MQFLRYDSEFQTIFESSCLYQEGDFLNNSYSEEYSMSRIEFCLCFILLLLPKIIFAQIFTNGFEEKSASNCWFNSNRVEDSAAVNGQFINRCMPEAEYGIGFRCKVPAELKKNNALLQIKACFSTPDSLLNSLLIISANKDGKSKYWKSIPLSDFFTNSNKWFLLEYEELIPNDYLQNSEIKIYIWNPKRNTIDVDDIEIELIWIETPSFLPQTNKTNTIGFPKVLTQTIYYELLFYPDNKTVILADRHGKALTRPISILSELGTEKDTILSESAKWKLVRKVEGSTQNEVILRNKNKFSKSKLKIISDFYSQNLYFEVETRFRKKGNLSRQSTVIQFVDSNFTVYRKNKLLDTIDFQNEYYLDREGFANGKGNREIGFYHNPKISSTQLNVRAKTAFLNFCYRYDTPFLHFPLDKDTSEYWIDKSAKDIRKGDKISNTFAFSVGSEIAALPRFMPVWDGFEAAMIWTEHADWTDIRTHRAVCFGHEDITQADSATGGFVKYNIPVTKSVFYNNPDKITNDQISDSVFCGLQATIKTDSIFFDFLKQLKVRGFDICLHTPEQYSTTKSNLRDALSFMKEHFSSPTWIDHGYNNSGKNNREDIVCDGFSKFKEKLWEQNGVRYFWNAYQEEAKPFIKWRFNSNFFEPYQGFGDAFPDRIFTHFPFESNSFLWSTTGTLEVPYDVAWNYFFSNENLQKLIDYHSIYTLHTYPAWTKNPKGFWQFDEVGKVEAMPGLNRSLEKIAALRDQNLLLPTTIDKMLSYHESLLKVEYLILENNSVQLKNGGDKDIDGLSLITASSNIKIEGKEIQSKKSGNETIFWFDLKAGEKVVICF